MSIINRFTGSQTNRKRDEYEPITVTDDLVARATDALPDGDRAIVVRPHKDNSGIAGMDEVLTSLHTVETESSGIIRSSTSNVSPAHAAEIRYGAAPNSPGTGASERVLTLQYIPHPEFAGTFKRQLEDKYANSHVDQRQAAFLDASSGQYLAGTTLALRRYTLYPIKNIAIDGFGADPTGAIMKEIVGAGGDGTGTADADVSAQIMFQPAARSWLQGVENGNGIADGRGDRDWDSASVGTPIEGAPSVQDLTYKLREPTIEKHRPLPWSAPEYIEHQPSKRDKDVATMLEEQDGKAWRIFVRLFAVSDDADEAARRVKRTAGMFRNYYEYRSEQTFIPEPVTGDELRTQFERACRREWEDAGIVKTQAEVAGLVNVPEAKDISTNKLRWSMAKPGDGVPPGTPRFPADEHGVEPGSPEEEVAMLDESDPDDPFWFGHGTKHGVEAGIYPGLLNAHMFVAGRTRYGKTTLTEHFCSQVFDRDRGGIVIDPKGDDADDFIKEWPEHRDEDDLIVMDLGLSPDGTGYEQIPRFNFMEIPPGYDADSRFAASMIEALADDITAMVAQAGGDDNYTGALMKRVTKTVSRGLLRSGRGVSLLDLACAVSSQDGLSEFSRWMDDERITFIRETAKRFEEKEDTDLEPLAGRMDEWIHNDAIRDLISARNPTFSIHEAVKEGKVIVVRFAKSAGESERRLLSTALIRRTYASKRVCDNDDPYYLVCDEFDKIVTEESNLHTILSEAGGHNYRCVLACQAPGSQLPGKVKNAVGNQIDTFLTFNPGEEEAGYVAKHHTIEADNLGDTPRFKCYLRTHTRSDDKTHSYLVDAFEPIREVRTEATGETPMTDEQVEQMKLRSMDRYGEEIASAKEQHEDSHFSAATAAGAGAGAGMGADRAAPDELDVSLESVRNRALKAVYDEVIRQGNGDGFVALDTVLPRLRRYLPNGESLSNTGQAWREVFQKIPDAYFAHRTDERDDGSDVTEVKALDTGFMNIGESQTAGNRLHWEQMADAYVPMTQLGFVFDILGQDEGMADHADDTMPDALAKLDDALYLDGIDDAGAIAERVNSYREEHPILDRLAGTEDAYIESEHTTGESQPSQTIRNLASAHNNGHRCLFLTRPESAEHLHGVVAGDEPCCRDDHSVKGERRFYTVSRSGSWKIDGQAITRPGASENVWVHDEQTGQYVLRDTNGTVHARFNTAAEIYEDASAYPAGGEQNVMPPVIPAYEFNGGDPTETDWDIITVPKPESDEDGNKRLLTPNDLELYHEGENETLVDVTLRLKSDSGGDGVNDTESAAHPQDTADDGANESGERDEEDSGFGDALEGLVG